MPTWPALGVSPKTIGDADDRAAARAIRAGIAKEETAQEAPSHLHARLVRHRRLPVLLTGFGWAVSTNSVCRRRAPNRCCRRSKRPKDADEQKAIAARYLKHYGNRDDEATSKVKAIDRELKVKEREHVLLNRFGNGENRRARPGADDDPDAYKKTMAALAAENEGDLAAARTDGPIWPTNMRRTRARRKALWGWLAQKKLNDLASKDGQLNELEAAVGECFRLDDKDVRIRRDFDNAVVAAIRLNELGDYTLA